jgi:kynureninase
MTDELLRFRGEFPILAKTNYLISNSLGAMPRGAAQGLSRYAEQWATRGVRAWGEGWWESAVKTGDLVAPLLGVKPGQVTMHQNVTLATAVFLSALDFRGERKKLVMVDLEFPSLQYLYHRHPDAEIVVIKSRDGVGVDASEVCAAIDERTRLVAFSHVLFRSSFLMDAAKIAKKARKMGALTLLDVFQSAGTMPIDLPKWEIDAAVGGCLKWLCGGPGNCFLWVDPKVARKLHPRLVGWQAHKRPFAFEPGPIDAREDAWKFLTGTPNVAALSAAAAGLEIIAQAGLDAIRAKSTHQTERLIRLAKTEGWKVTAPEDPKRRGGTVAVDLQHGKEIAAELNARDVCCDYRPGAGVRFSPHFYTRDDELDRAVLEVRRIQSDKSWKKHEAVAKTVT